MNFRKHQNLAVKAIPILSLIVVFTALVFFGLSRINRALAVAIPGSWLQTDSSALETGFNLAGNTKTQTGVRGTGNGAGVGLASDNITTGLVIGGTFGNNGSVLKTANGGTSWNNNAIWTNELHDISFANANTGWAVGLNGVILKTANSGITPLRP